MKTITTLSILLISIQIGFAQENKLWLSLGAGQANTSSDNKTNLIGNGYAIQGDAFIPFYRKGWDGTVKGGSFALGINVSGNYTAVKNLSPNDNDVASQYQIFGGNLTVASQAEAKMSGSFSGLLGLQGSISFGKFNLSPSVNTGYLHLNQKGYAQNATTTINGQTQQKELIRSEQQKTSGLILKPQLKVGYNIASNLTIFVGSAFSKGPEINHTTQYLVPQGGFNDRKTYEASQLAKGTWESRTTASRYNVTELNFGLTMALGKKKPVKSGTGLGAGSGAAAASYARMSNANSSPQSNIQDSAAVKNRISMNVTTPKQQSATIKNPLYESSGNSGENPLFEGKGASPLRVEKANADRKPDVSKDEPVITSEKPSKFSKKGYDYYKASSDLIAMDDVQNAPGQPIKGVIVKGGKNPGGKKISVVSNVNGEIFLNNLSKGNYTFQLAMPSQPSGKSISEQGVKRGETDASQARPGNPIGGIIVKGGKNPGGSFINLTVNDKGQVGFDVLEKGSYKLIIQTPETPNADAKKEKVVEKATSGLKDTLKTQV